LDYDVKFIPSSFKIKDNGKVPYLHQVYKASDKDDEHHFELLFDYSLSSIKNIQNHFSYNRYKYYYVMDTSWYLGYCYTKNYLFQNLKRPIKEDTATDSDYLRF
jgi:hypothetical protein